LLTRVLGDVPGVRANPPELPRIAPQRGRRGRGARVDHGPPSGTSIGRLSLS